MERTDNYEMIAEGVLAVIISKLSVDRIYRLYRISSLIRKIVDIPNRYFWRKLIERDLGVVPLFKIDLKLHYLRLMKFPIAGEVCVQQKGKFGIYTSKYRDVIVMVDRRIVTSSGKITDFHSELEALGPGERIIDMGNLNDETIFSTNLRIIHNLPSSELVTALTPFKGESRIVRISCPECNDEDSRENEPNGTFLVSTYNGECYYMRKYKVYKLPMPEPIISVRISGRHIKILSYSGNLYTDKVSKSGKIKIDKPQAGVQYISARSSHLITFDGDVYDSVWKRGTIPIVLDIDNDQYIDKDLHLQLLPYFNINSSDLKIQIKFEGVLQYYDDRVRLLK